jgi:hypothetical protein
MIVHDSNKLSRDLVAWATEIVDRSGVAPQIESMFLNRRPRGLTVRGLMVAETIAVREYGRAHTWLAATVLHRMPPAAQRAFGVPPDLITSAPHRPPKDKNRKHTRKNKAGARNTKDGKQKRPESCVYYLRKEILKRLDTAPDNRPDLPEDQRWQLAEHRRQLLNQRATRWLPPLPPYDTIAIDATDVPSWARRRSRRKLDHLRAQRLAGIGRRRRLDLSAARGHRTPTSSNPSDFFHGYMLVSAVMTQSHGRRPVPLLVLQHVVDPADIDVPATARWVLRRYAEQGRPLRYVVADKGITVSEEFLELIWQLGGAPVFDLYSYDLKEQGDEAGGIVLFGWLFCPKTPRWLLDSIRPIPRKLLKSDDDDGDDEDDEDAEKVEEDIRKFLAHRDELFRYAARRHTRRHGMTPARFADPAAAGRVRCQLCKPSLQLDKSLPYVRDHPHREKAGPLCIDSTVVLPIDVSPRTQQAELWASDKWFSVYKPGRAAIEGMHGNVKNHATENFRHGSHAGLSHVATSWYVAIAVTVANDRLFNRYYEEHGNDPAVPEHLRRAWKDDLLLGRQHELEARYRELFGED